MAAEAAPPRLMFATRNLGKIGEMEVLLSNTDWLIEHLPAELEDYEEIGSTFADNARGKALFAAARVDIPVLADDSGLEIDALGGEPGVRSARYVDPGIDQAERNRVVLEKMEGVPARERGARFVCHLVLARGDAIVHESTGVCEGSIATRPRGNDGFGYDPLFLVPDLGVTFAEIDRAEKSARSHRGAAARAMARFLKNWNAAIHGRID